jgi:cyclopropane-fatty-acyl-phospholipid synthase
MILKTTKNQPDLPRYFSRVMAILQDVQCGRLDIKLRDGRVFRAEGAGPGPVAEVHVHNCDLFARLIRDGDLGFCEAYLDQWWSSPDLQAFMDFLYKAGDGVYDGFPGIGLVRAYERLRFWLHRNNRAQARRNISYHYDLGNEFYALWLDETMTYSSAMFETGQESLEAAQIRKYASMVDKMGVKPGDHILEIGCGWGGFAEYAAGQRGLRVTGLTISQEQLSYAQERIGKAGLSDHVDLRLQDYRDERGQYDGIASIEMLEAVGEKYWPVYFNTLHERLKPGANATLQVITVTDQRWRTYRRSVDFIQKHIFPGGMLLTPTILRDQAEKAGLSMIGSVEFGPSYGLTLRRWHETFNHRWDQVADLGFDERFRRMWNFYLTACAAAFDSGKVDVTQVTVTRPAL